MEGGGGKIRDKNLSGKRFEEMFAYPFAGLRKDKVFVLSHS